VSRPAAGQGRPASPPHPAILQLRERQGAPPPHPATVPGPSRALAPNRQAPQAAHPVQRSRRIDTVKAYRVQARDNPKVMVENNRVKSYVKEDNFGINISFINDDHAILFLKHKGKDRDQYELVEWDFDAELYQMIQRRMKKKQPDEKWKGKDKWNAVEKCPIPVATSDSSVDDKDNAPHLKSDKWIDVLNDYATGGAATVHDGASYADDESKDEEEEEADTVIVLEKDGNYEWPTSMLKDLGKVKTMTKKEADEQGVAYEDYTG
jgi:hypothetical protein